MSVSFKSERRFRITISINPMVGKNPYLESKWQWLFTLAALLAVAILFLLGKFLIWCMKQIALTITSTNNRRINHVPSAPIPDRHFIVELPQEVEDSNPPAYTNFSPPSYEEAFEMFKKSYLDSGRNARRLDQIGLNELVY